MDRTLDTGVGMLAALFVNGMLSGGVTFGFIHWFYARVRIKDDVKYVEPKKKSSDRKTQQ